jgi:thiol-disulfide isomerase/thioredoxin
LFVLVSCFSAKARQAESLEAYYFFSSTCPDCAKSTPFVKRLSREITMQGFLYGDGDAEQMPFKVWNDDEAARKRYDVRTFPMLVLVKNGAEIQAFIGDRDIQDAPIFLSALRKGTGSVSEMVEKKPQTPYSVIGWVVSRGEYFRNPRFYLTDRKTFIPVKPWLPLEAVKSRFNKTPPRLMSDIINKPVMLEGILTTNNDDLQFTVRREITLE